MRVGVTEGAIRVGATCVDVGGTAVKVGGDEVGVEEASVERPQALSSSALNTKIMIDGNHLLCFILFSLSAMLIGWIAPHLNVVKVFCRLHCAKRSAGVGTNLHGFSIPICLIP